MPHFSLFRSLGLSLLILFAAVPGQAKVMVSFWSQEIGVNFPHAFFTVRGYLEDGTGPINESYGFTARALTPGILFGNVKGHVEHPDRDYMEMSDVRFRLEVSDEQYRDLMALAAAWDEDTGDPTYNLNKRNCVHFIAEAARAAGLEAPMMDDLKKKPRSFLIHVADLNPGKVEIIDMEGPAYWERVEAEEAAAIAATSETTGATAEPAQ